MNSPTIISRFSSWFVQNSRASILLFVAVLSLGAFTYSNLLQREGFPEVAFPIGVVTTPYFVDDAELVDSEVTQPLGDELQKLEYVDTYSTETDSNFSRVVVTFVNSETSETGVEKLQEDLMAAVLPEGVEPQFIVIDAASVDGINDFNFAISASELEYEELLEVAQELSAELETIDAVTGVEINEYFETQVNPRTGEELQIQTRSDRVGYREDDGLVFQPSITIGLQKNDSFDVVQFSEIVRAEITSFVENEVEGLDVIYGGDVAVTINSQIASLEENTLSGLLVIVVITALFIGWRAAVITFSFIPVVLASVFVSLYLLGYTLNVISLFGLILVLGLLVDDVIVVVEAIDNYKKQGLKGLQAVRQAISKVGQADLLGTITTLLVFIPMLAIGGILGEFIAPIPVTVIITLVLSLVIALSLFAWLSGLILSTGTPENPGYLYYLFNGFSIGIQKLGRRLGGLVRAVYAKWYMAVAGVLVSFVVIGLGASTAASVSFDIFPAPKDANDIQLVASLEEGVNVEEAVSIAEELEEAISTQSEYVNQVTYGSLNDSSVEVSISLVDYNERDKTAVDIAQDIESETNAIEDADVRATLISAGPPQEEYPFSMQVFADDIKILEEVARDVDEFLIDYVYESGDETVAVSDTRINNLDSIARLDGERYAIVQAKFDQDSVDNTLLSDLEEQIVANFDQDYFDSFDLNASETLGFDQGIETDNAEAFEGAVFAFAVALLLMYGFLVVQFNSFSQPLLVYTAIPFGFTGIFPGLLISNNPLSFFVMIGIIALAGIVVNNTIILLDFANQGVKDGDDPVSAIANAIAERFRPLVTTSVTTVAGLLPLALTDPFWESLAFTIIFGLFASTTMVVLFFPAYYILLEKLRSLVKRMVSLLG